MRIIGIDPGTRYAGFGVIAADGARLRRIAGGCIRAGPNELPKRLAAIHHGLAEAIRRHAPEEAAIETVFAGDNIRTAIAIGEARGAAVIAAAAAGLPVIGYEPATVKRAVAGSGGAGKNQIREMVRVLLELPEPPDTEHEADALALAVTHALRRRTADGAGTSTLPAQVREALKPRALPEHILAQLPPNLPRNRSRHGLFAFRRGK